MSSKGPHAKTVAARLWDYWKMMGPLGGKVKGEEVVRSLEELPRRRSWDPEDLSLSLSPLCLSVCLSPFPSPLTLIFLFFPLLLSLASVLNILMPLQFSHSALSRSQAPQSSVWFETFGIIIQNNLFLFMKYFAVECLPTSKEEIVPTFKILSFYF